MPGKNEIATEVVTSYRVDAFTKMRDSLALARNGKSTRPLKSVKMDALMLRRHHKHLVKPYQNTYISRQRIFPTGALTAMILGSCFILSYFYARLKKDEYLRRVFHQRYFNFITLFDKFSFHLDRQYLQTLDLAQNFDSAAAWWRFKKQKIAEYRARRALEPEIQRMQANDALSKTLLKLDNIEGCLLCDDEIQASKRSESEKELSKSLNGVRDIIGIKKV